MIDIESITLLDIAHEYRDYIESDIKSRRMFLHDDEHAELQARVTLIDAVIAAHSRSAPAPGAATPERPTATE